MAMRRRPPAPVAPVELLWLDPADWPAMPWLEVFALWQGRRREFARTHPDSALGNALEMLRVERRVMDEHRRVVFADATN